MPGGASKLRDVRKLADTRATLDLDIPVAELPGLPAEVVASGGQLHAHLQFGREQGFMVAQAALTGEVTVICQRCINPMALQIDTNSQVLLLESEAEADRAPPDWETYLAADGRLSLAALAAEELLLALPVVPRHAQESECKAATSDAPAATAARQPAQVETSESTARPFADLRAMLERGTDASSARPKK